MALILSQIKSASEIHLADGIYGNIFASAGLSGLVVGKKYLMSVNITGAGAFASHVDANKDGFDIDERDESHSPNYMYIITPTATTVKIGASGMGTNDVKAWLIPIE